MNWIKYRINDLKYAVNKWRINHKHSRKPIPQELWNLDVTFAKMMSNYIKHFRCRRHGFPANLSSDEEWEEILLKMQKGFEDYAKSLVEASIGSKEYNDIQETLRLFSKYFVCLWD